jgi:hypothetical protein
MADGASERNRMNTVDIPLIIRGQIIETDMQRFEARADGVAFRAPRTIGIYPARKLQIRDALAIQGA